MAQTKSDSPRPPNSNTNASQSSMHQEAIGAFACLEMAGRMVSLLFKIHANICINLKKTLTIQPAIWGQMSATNNNNTAADYHTTNYLDSDPHTSKYRPVIPMPKTA
jgi:hypothetical protein